MWVYQIDLGYGADKCWIVGFYRPDGTWAAVDGFATAGQARAEVHYLNGKAN